MDIAGKDKRESIASVFAATEAWTRKLEACPKPNWTMQCSATRACSAPVDQNFVFAIFMESHSPHSIKLKLDQSSVTCGARHFRGQKGCRHRYLADVSRRDNGLHEATCLPWILADSLVTLLCIL